MRTFGLVLFVVCLLLDGAVLLFDWFLDVSNILTISGHVWWAFRSFFLQLLIPVGLAIHFYWPEKRKTCR